MQYEAFDNKKLKGIIDSQGLKVGISRTKDGMVETIADHFCTASSTDTASRPQKKPRTCKPDSQVKELPVAEV